MRSMFGPAVAAAVIASGVLSVGAQIPARDNPVARTSTASIQGRVIEANSDIGLVRALVTISGAQTAREGRSVMTDEQGRYAFGGLSAGRYTLQAAKVGYVTLGPGQRRARQPPRTIEVADGQNLAETIIALPRAGVIVVRVSNSFGEPAALHGVMVQEYRFVNGQRQLMPARHAREATSTVQGVEFTNDLGLVRVHGLAPGEYYVGAGYGPAGDLSISTGGAAQSVTVIGGTGGAAQPVMVIGGQEAEVTLQLAAETATARRVRVSGFVRGSTGAPATNATLSTAETRAYVPILPDGSFEMNVAPGRQHTITIRAGQGPGEVEEWGRTTFSVQDEDVIGVTVDTVKAGTLRGRFIFDTGGPALDLQPGAVQLAVVPTPETFGPLPADPKWNADWSFEISRLAGPYTLRLRQPAGGWHLKAIVRDGKDVTDTTVEVNGDTRFGDLQVLLTQKIATLTGAVVDSRNASVSEYVAVVFPEDRDRWRQPQNRFIAAGRSDEQGRFRITGLPPGRYLAAAVEFLEAGEERDAYVLGRLSQDATPLTLEEGESKTIGLRLADY